MGEGAGVVLADAAGKLVAKPDTTTIVPATQPVIPVGGVDGTTLRTFRVDSGGRQKVQADALPLPTGASSETKLETVRVLLASIDGKDFATEAKLEAVRVLLASLDAKDFATNTTLSAQAVDIAALLVNSADIETILTAIRDTAGIADVAKWLGSAAPTVGQKTMPSSLPVVLSSDHSAIPITTLPTAETAAVVSFLKDSGGSGSEDMAIDGESTPVKYEFNADGTEDIQLVSLRLVMSAADLIFDGTTFGKSGSPLAVGVSIDIVANGGTFTSQLALLKINEDFRRAVESDVIDFGTANITATLLFPGKVVLEGGTADEISILISDDLATGPSVIKYFTATLVGVTL